MPSVLDSLHKAVALLITIKQKDMRLKPWMIEDGKSKNGGWSAKQVALFGETLTRGWKGRIIGKDFPDKTIEEFLKLRNEHLNTK